MTQEQFRKIEALRDKITRYEKIIELAESDDEDYKRKGFAYCVPSTFSFDYLRYPVDDDELNNKILNLVKEKLSEMNREFNDITIM